METHRPGACGRQPWGTYLRKYHPAASEERSEEDEEQNQDEEKEKGSDSDMVIESEDEDGSDREMDDQDPWETLRQEVEESLSSTYDKKVNKFLKEGGL